MDTIHLPTSHSQRLNSRKPLGTGCCEWLWSIATWANAPGISTKKKTN